MTTAGTEQLSCQELVELVTDYFEGALAPEAAGEFERHIAGCTGCHEYVEQMRRTIELTGTLTTADVPPEAAERLLAAFRDWRER
jgi:anti-sigma factor RsiW